jgi:D-xylose transport system permease protein
MPQLNGLDLLAGRFRMAPVLLALVLIWAYFWWANPLFLSPRNLTNLSLQIVVTSVVALGLMFVLIVGEIDLSVASVGAVSAAVTGGLSVNHGVDTVVAVCIGLAAGAAIGAIQGAIVTRLRAPAFIVTLGTSLALQGVLLDLLPADTNLISLVGQPLGRLGTLYLPLGLSVALVVAVVAVFTILAANHHRARRNHGLASSAFTTVLAPPVALAIVSAGAVAVFQANKGVPLLVAVLLGILFLFSYCMTQTRFGLYQYAVGANPEAARRAGIAVGRVRVTAFVLTGLFASLGGIVAASRVLGVSPDSADPTLLLEAVAAVVIGGVSLFGGRGSVWAALSGSLVIGSVSNGMLLVDASTQTRLEVQGAILTVAVVVDAWLTRRSGTRR